MKQIHSSDEMIALKEDHEMVLVYFGSPICSVCQDMKPKLEVMIASYPLIKAVNVEMRESPEVAAINGIFTAPAVILFIQGKETIREAGIISLIKLEEKIRRYYKLVHE